MPVRSNSVIFVLVTIFIDAIGFGIVMPVLPGLIIHLGHTDLAGATAIYGWMALLYAIAQFVFGPIIGNLSDRFGRRPVLLGALAGLCADYVLLSVANTLLLLFVGRAIGGILGGSYGPAQAALADRAAPDERARLFGFVGAAFGIGFVIGPAIGGVLGELDPRAPFVAAAVLAAINFVYGLTIFPETLDPANRRGFDWRRANPLGALGAARKLPGMLGASSVLFLWQIASLVYPLTWSYYGIAAFHWSTRLIGLSLATVGTVMALAQTFLTGRIVRRFGERGGAMIGIGGATVAFIGYAFAQSTWQVFVLMLLLAVQASAQPSLSAMLSRRGTPETQGEVQGIAAMAMGLGSIVAPLLLNPVFAYFTGPRTPVFFPGAAFLLAAVFGVLSMIALQLLPRVKSPPIAS